MTDTHIEIQPEPHALTSVVIVDDEQSILASLRSLLRRHRYTVQLFDEGAHAADYIAQHTPDIIISDMRMPMMSGVEFLEHAALLCPTASRLMLSGYEDKSVVLDAIGRGLAQQYILKPWDDAEMLQILENVRRTRTEMRKQSLAEMLRDISELPSSPQIKIQLQRVLNNENRSIRDLASEVEKDPALFARILHIANSIHYAARVPVSTALEATSFIGVEYVESLILAMCVFRHTQEQGGDAVEQSLNELWQHAVHRAVLGRTIAAQWPDFKQQTIAYTVCLLQDIGFIVRLQIDPALFVRLVNTCTDLHLSLHAAESKFYGVSHAAVGAALLRLWNFPDAIVSAIEHHHGETQGDVLTQIAQIADIVESDDRTRPHDARIDPLIEEWMSKKTPTQ